MFNYRRFERNLHGYDPGRPLHHHTYFIVAHSLCVVRRKPFRRIRGDYFWFPKMFGRMMNETWGKIHFNPRTIFFNCTFFPMHNLGLNGMMRRIADPSLYDHLRSSQPINVLSVSAFALGLSTIPFWLTSSIASLKAESRIIWRSTTSSGRFLHLPGMGISKQPDRIPRALRI